MFINGTLAGVRGFARTVFFQSARGNEAGDNISSFSRGGTHRGCAQSMQFYAASARRPWRPDSTKNELLFTTVFANSAIIEAPRVSYRASVIEFLNNWSVPAERPMIESLDFIGRAYALERTLMKPASHTAARIIHINYCFREDNNKPNHVLLFTIINPVYPITVVSLSSRSFRPKHRSTRRS